MLVQPQAKIFEWQLSWLELDGAGDSLIASSKKASSSASPTNQRPCAFMFLRANAFSATKPMPSMEQMLSTEAGRDSMRRCWTKASRKVLAAL